MSDPPLSPYEGSIDLLIGPMFADKSSEMLSRVRRHALANRSAVIIKWAKDTRYAGRDIFATNSGLQQSTAPGSPIFAPIRVVPATSLSAVTVTEPVVGVDEGQFFPDLVDCCERWANEGRCVIVAALDGTSERKAFPSGQVMELIPLCETVTKKNGICMVCRRRNSPFSKRIDPNSPLIMIGGPEKYVTVCRKCHHSEG